MDYQPSYPTTPKMACDNHNSNSLFCPSPPESRKPSIMFDGMNVVLPFQIQLSAENSSSSVVNGPEREVIFSLKPRSSFTPTRVEADGETTKVALESIPPPPFGYKQSQEVTGSLSNPSKLPSQVRQRPFAEAQTKQRHTLSARCA
mmetsp:Transcript_11084/g.15882  ORF Transcript_11084/g.15882 Transcript_11084/m.15882 type:complete len:146 (+) Transcript_11084:242-679(+)